MLPFVIIPQGSWLLKKIKRENNAAENAKSLIGLIISIKRKINSEIIQKESQRIYVVLLIILIENKRNYFFLLRHPSKFHFK